MTKVKIGYKVVVVDREGRFRPAIVNHKSQTPGLFYRLGHWIKRRRGLGPYCVFRSRSNALESFSLHPSFYSQRKLFKCEYIPSRLRTVWCKQDEGKKQRPEKMPLFSWKTSALADEVKLLEEV